MSEVNIKKGENIIEITRLREPVVIKTTLTALKREREFAVSQKNKWSEKIIQLDAEISQAEALGAK